MSDVLIVGAGPVGLTLAIELARHGARSRIVDRATAPLPYCRAIGVTPRTLEVWDDMGIAEEMIASGVWLTGMRSIVDGEAKDVSAPDFGLPYGNLGIPQYATERLLTAHLAIFGGLIERGVELTKLIQDDGGVDVTLRAASGAVEQARFKYVIGCDGAHSAVRRALAIDFQGEAYPWPFMLGDVRADLGLPYGVALRALRLVQGGPPDMLIAIPLPEKNRYRVSMLAPPELEKPGGERHGIQTETRGPSLEELQKVADALLPGGVRFEDLRWSSVFRISMRIADRYRVGRAFIAGDAAHIHPPTGGQGMNTGIQDAYNLAWKLALVLRGDARAQLLDSYEEERRPVGLDVVARTRAASESYGREKGGGPDRGADTQVFINYRDSRLSQDDASPDAAGPRAGDRAPDVESLRRDGVGRTYRLFDLLRGPKFTLLVNVVEGEEALNEISVVAGALRAAYGDAINIFAITSQDAPAHPEIQIVRDAERRFQAAYGSHSAAFLIRPDGHVGWRGATAALQPLADYVAQYFTAKASRTA